MFDQPEQKLFSVLKVITRSIKRRQPCWEETDCCGISLKKEPADKRFPIVIEKVCCPCPFNNWEPKIPVLGIMEKRENEESEEKERCYAGKIILHKKTHEQIREEGRVCLARCSVKNLDKNICSEKVKRGLKRGLLEALYPDVEIPEATWNHDCNY